MRARSGFTLLEMLLVIFILGMLTGIAGLSLARVPVHAPISRVQAELAEARRAAVLDGRIVTVEIATDSSRVTATFFPDGSGLVDGNERVDRLSGRPDKAARRAR